MKRRFLIIAFILIAISGAIGYKYRRVILQKMRSSARTSSAMNQRNPLHLKEGACIAKGLDLPQKKLSQLSTVTGLTTVSSTSDYHVENMTHSKPLLTKRGQAVLKTIASNFQKRLQDQGYKKQKLVITSMTRSLDSQIELGKTNENAAAKSAHLYGSTFDLSYKKFRSVSESKGKQPSRKVLEQTLESTLAELKKKGTLVGIKEYRQPCYHITASCVQ